MIVSFLAPDSKQQSGFLTWDDMGKWQRDLAVGRRDPTQEISQKVMALTTSISSLDQKMAENFKIHAERDSVMLRLNLGSADGSRILRRMSSATDMEIAKTKRHDEFDVEASRHRVVLRRDKHPSWCSWSRHSAMIYLFNHVILAIKLPDGAAMARYEAVFEDPRLGRLLIFEPTDEKTPIGHLQSDLQGNYSLLVTPDGGEKSAGGRAWDLRTRLHTWPWLRRQGA